MTAMIERKGDVPDPGFGELVPDPEDCEHSTWNPDNRRCLDCGHIDAAPTAPSG